MRKQLEAHAEGIFSDDVEDGWVLHFTPSYNNLYKKSWVALDARKYSIPSLFIFAGNSQCFLKNSYLNKLVLGVTHLAPNTKQNYPDYAGLFGNHGRNIGIPLLDDSKLATIKCDDTNNANARKDFYKNIIKEINSKLTTIDEGVEELLNSDAPTTPEEIIQMFFERLGTRSSLKKSVTSI